VINSACDGGAACTAAALTTWHGFHQWSDITADELPGVICYLRAIAPESQNGSSNFGGGGTRTRPDGGTRPAFDGGRPVIDSGAPAVVDSGAPPVVDSGAPAVVDSGAPAIEDGGAE
jgi:hypothetical protein